MKFKKEDMLRLTEEDPSEGFEIVEEDEWTQDHKHQLKDWIFKYEGKFYQLTESRSGSPFTDWYYDSDDWGSQVEVEEVEPVEVKITKWKVVKNAPQNAG